MADHRLVTTPNFNDVTQIGLETSPTTSRSRHERLSCVLFLSSERKKVNKLCFPSILRCKLCLHPFQNPTNTLSCSKVTLNHWLNISTLVAKFDSRFKIHHRWEKNNPSKASPCRIGSHPRGFQPGASLVPGRYSDP